MTKISLVVMAAALAAAGSAHAGDASARAAANKKRLESDADHLLHVYVAKGSPQDPWMPQDPYLLGYLYYKRGDEAQAKPLFERAVQEGAFTARSRYMLAFLAWKKFKADGSQGDLSGAFSQLDKAIAEDPEYPSPYYLRGMMRWGQGHRPKEALEDVARAASLFSGACRDVNDPNEADAWRRPDTKELLPGLKKVGEDCAKRWR